MTKIKFCECGCGQPTFVAKKTEKRRGLIKGKPCRFIGHHNLKIMVGELAPRWQGGRSISSEGYVLIHAPGHPRATPNGYVFEHILVLEKILGRPILVTECPHHINGVKTDNSPGNLMLFATKGMNTAYHHQLRKNQCTTTK